MLSNIPVYHCKLHLRGADQQRDQQKDKLENEMWNESHI